MTTKFQFPPSFFCEEYKEIRVDFDTKRLWAALLDLLAEFDRVCRKHGIRYSIDSGTMLGKIRHDGIIPWDDDVDVMITRPEYEKLLQVAENEFCPPYFLQTMESDPEAAFGHPRLLNSSMTGIAKCGFVDGRAVYKSFNQGLPIDIFVFDAIPDDQVERENYFIRLSILKKKMRRARDVRYIKPVWGFSPGKAFAYFYTLWEKFGLLKVRIKTGVDPVVWFSRKFDDECKKYNGVETRDMAPLLWLPHPPEKRIFERIKVVETEDVDFLGLKVQMIKSWDYYLKHLYGNWHKHVVGASEHGGLFIDLDHPYTHYF